MSGMQRRKGAGGERELVGLLRIETGWPVERRCRQHEGDCDLLGVSGWSIECKRRRTAARADLLAWWAQAVAQAQTSGELPALFYRCDRMPWRVIWPLAVLLDVLPRDAWLDYDLTCETSIAGWASVAREHEPTLKESARVPVPSEHELAL